MVWCSELQSTVGVHARRGVPSKARKEGKRRCAGTLPPVRATRRRCGGPWPSRSSPRSFLPRRWESCSRSGQDGRRSPRPLPPPPTSGATAARRATRTRRRPGRPLTTRWRCRWRPSDGARRLQRRHVPAPGEDLALLPEGRQVHGAPPRGPTARCTTTRWPTPSASTRCSSTWSAFPGGRLQALSAGWDAQQKRWFHVDPHGAATPGDWLHWTRPGQNWNGMCADCHSTDVRKGYDPESDTYRTTWAEVWSAASRATDRARATWPGPEQPEGKRDRLENAALVTRTSRLTGQELGGSLRRLPLPAGAVHGPGHARRRAPRPLSPGAPLAAGSSTPTARSSTRTSSGNRSPRARCTRSASAAPTATTRTRGSAAPRGTRSAPAATAPTPTTTAPTTSTRRSGRGSRARRCSASAATCQGQNFMVVHFRRDHSIRVPRPDLTASLGVPNACSSGAATPTGRSPWVQAHYDVWYGKSRKPTWHHLIAGGGRAPRRRAGPGNARGRCALVRHRRATAVELLGSYAGPAAAQGRSRRRSPTPRR